MHVRHWLVMVVGALALLLSGGAHAQEGSAVGTYRATVEGVSVEIVLNKNGTATIEGETSKWTQLPGQLVFTDPNGDRFVATYDGKSFTLKEQGLTLVFHRLTGGGAGSTAQPLASRPAPDEGYRPGKVLKGKTYRVKGAHASFTLPKGFVAREGEHQGQAGILISKKQRPDGLVVIVPKLLGRDEMRQRVSTLLEQAAREMVGDAQVEVVVPPKDLRLGKHDAAYLELRGQDGGQILKARMGGIRIERWGAVFLALYPESKDATYGAVFDTIFTSFKAKPPKENKRLASQIAGCWEIVSSSGGGSGSAYSETRYRFGRDGSYRYSHMTSVSVPGGAGANNISEEAGTFAVFGSEVSTTDSKTGKSSSFSVRLSRGFLLIGGNRYTPCS